MVSQCSYNKIQTPTQTDHPHSPTLLTVTFFMRLEYSKCTWISNTVLVLSPTGKLMPQILTWLAL